MIARPGHALSHYRSNNAVRRSMREAAKSSAAGAEKATKMAEKLDKAGTVLSVISVAVDVGVGIAAVAVGFAVSSLITYAVDEQKAFKGKTFREAAKDSIFKFGKSIFGE